MIASSHPAAIPVSSRWIGPVALAGLGVYFALMALASALLVTSGRSDDAEAFLLSQSLEWGYETKNPPGFYWLAYLVMQITGPELATIFALRMAGIFAMFAGLYAIARRLQPDPLLAVCAGFAMLATIHFHWYLLTYLTNTTLAMALAPYCVLALFRLKSSPSLLSYALFGLVLGAGILTRYNFAVFAAALVLAGLAAPEWRRLLLRPMGLVPLGIVILLAATHLVWVAAQWQQLSGYLDTTIGIGGTSSYLAGLLPGLADLVSAPVEVLVLPLGLLLLACFPRAFRRIRVVDPRRRSEIDLIGRTILFGLGLMAVYVLAGASHLRPHHLFFLALAPIWLLARIERADLPRWSAPVFAGSLAALVVVAGAANVLTNVRDLQTCERCAEYQPMADYADSVRAAGFTRGSILSLARRQDFPAEALRAEFPNARILSAEYPIYAPPAGSGDGDCLIVWEGWRSAPGTADILAGADVPRIGEPLPPQAIAGRAEGRIHLSGQPATGMSYVLVPGGLGDCR